MATASRPPAALVSLALLLTACGGGGGGGETGVGAEPPAVALATAGGIWSGTLTTSASGPRSIEGVITEDGRLALRDETDMMYFGTLSISGRQASGKISGVRPSGSGNGTGDISVSITERVSLSGTLTFQGAQNGSSNSGTLALSFQPLYNRPSSHATVAGNYVPLTQPSSAIVTVDSLGRVFTQSTEVVGTCTSNGQLGVIDPRFSVYDFSRTTDCGQGEQLQTGLAVLDDSTQPRTLTIYQKQIVTVSGSDILAVFLWSLVGV
jgi:hypothetical protein